MIPAYFQLRQMNFDGPVRGIGLMSGTSLDAIDAALVEFYPLSDRPVKLISYIEREIDEGLRKRIYNTIHPEWSSVELICQLNFELGELFAAAAMEAARQANVSLENIDFIGSHGQTIYHIPHPNPDREWQTPSTLQVGDPCVIAERTGVQTVADFRVRDMAAGGRAAPLIPFADAYLFANPDRDILCLNIGGIANFTLIPKAGDILAFDTGPGNMVMDLIVRKQQTELRYDVDGVLARQGKVVAQLLDSILDLPYFKSPPPKSTGHEFFGEQFVDGFLQVCKDLPLIDTLATACEFTALSITNAYKDFILPYAIPQEIIVSGGGTKNGFLMERLARLCPELRWRTVDDLGIPSDALEAIGFAVLAFATLCGLPSNVPSVTGAKAPVVLGKIVPGSKPLRFFNQKQ